MESIKTELIAYKWLFYSGIGRIKIFKAPLGLRSFAIVKANSIKYGFKLVGVIPRVINTVYTGIKGQ